VSHGDDTMYVIKTTYGSPHDNVEDAKLIPVMVNVWTSFMKTGCVKDQRIENSRYVRKYNSTFCNDLNPNSKNECLSMGNPMSPKDPGSLLEQVVHGLVSRLI